MKHAHEYQLQYGDIKMSMLSTLSTATHLSVFDLTILAVVVIGVLAYVAFDWSREKLQERSRARFFSWLDKISEDNVIALYRNTGNVSKYREYVVAEAIKSRMIHNKLYATWMANRGIELLWDDLAFNSKLAACK